MRTEDWDQCVDRIQEMTLCYLSSSMLEAVRGVER